MAIKLEGNWAKGRAFDVHTLSSNYLGPDEHGHKQWENKRSEMGELVYQLKYQGKRENVSKIVDLISNNIKGLETFDIIVPMPASKSRAVQPVDEIAKELGQRMGVEVLNLLEKADTGSQIKDVEGRDERRELLEKSMKLSGTYDISGKKVLLLDDLYRSGVTLEIATDILYKQAKAEKVCVLTMTKTRSNR